MGKSIFFYFSGIRMFDWVSIVGIIHQQKFKNPGYPLRKGWCWPNPMNWYELGLGFGIIFCQDCSLSFGGIVPLMLPTFRTDLEVFDLNFNIPNIIIRYPSEIEGIRNLSRWWFQTCFISTPIWGRFMKIPILTYIIYIYIIFQMGWFNHQPSYIQIALKVLKTVSLMAFIGIAPAAGMRTPRAVRVRP